MNRSVFIVRTGPPESLEVREIEVPSPQDGELLVRVHAVGVNFADVVARRGLYPDAPKRPFVPGYEVAGLVEDLGAGVEGWKPGQRVVSLTHFGAYSEHVCVSAQEALPIPEHMPFVDAAAMPLNFVTAYHSLFHTGLVARNTRVLIHAAAGGVGLAAVQLARHAGAEVFGTAGSDAKVEFLQDFGVDHAINYRQEDFAKRIREITHREGLDVILDSVGGAQLRKDLALLRPNGRLVSLGIATFIGKSKPRILLELLRFPRPSLLKLLQNSQGIYGVNLNKLLVYPDMLRDVLREIFRLYDDDVVKPVIARTFPLEQASAAHRMMEDRANIGKIVLIVAEG